jgi:guanosine-3',5'-bis(diphosphate) 3'-pyrophosphohydrolase
MQGGIDASVVDKVQTAKAFAYERHFGQLDDSGAPYFTAHVEHVVRIVSQVTNNPDILAAAYLHDLLEDTETTYEELVGLFGGRVAGYVLELTKEGRNRFPRLRSTEAIMIKFADRLSNLSRMEPWDEGKRERYVRSSVIWEA